MNKERLRLPRRYAVIDADRIASAVPAERLTCCICDFASELATSGVTLMQYRATKRSDLCLAAGFDGVYLGENDPSPEGARAVLENRHWVGVSTHTAEGS